MGNLENCNNMPNGVSPQSLTRESLLSVSHIYLIIQLIAFVDPNLFNNLYNAAKEQMGNKKFSKWEKK